MYRHTDRAAAAELQDRQVKQQKLPLLKTTTG